MKRSTEKKLTTAEIIAKLKANRQQTAASKKREAGVNAKKAEVAAKTKAKKNAQWVAWVTDFADHVDGAGASIYLDDGFDHANTVSDMVSSSDFNYSSRY